MNTCSELQVQAPRHPLYGLLRGLGWPLDRRRPRRSAGRCCVAGWLPASNANWNSGIVCFWSILSYITFSPLVSCPWSLVSLFSFSSLLCMVSYLVCLLSIFSFLFALKVLYFLSRLRLFSTIFIIFSIFFVQFSLPQSYLALFSQLSQEMRVLSLYPAGRRLDYEGSQRKKGKQKALDGGRSNPRLFCICSEEAKKSHNRVRD